MLRRLQITMKAEDLKRRIEERVTELEMEAATVDARLQARAGDSPFDVNEEDGYMTVDQLRSDRQRIRDRITQLTLLRHSLVPDATYALSSADLRFAGLVRTRRGLPDGADHWVDSGRLPMDGLKLTFTGEELRSLLDMRRNDHEVQAARWRHELTRGPQDQTEDAPLLPDQMCENEAEGEEWRAELCIFIRDHIDVDAVYRLGEKDLKFGDLLPQKPGGMEQAEYEERRGVGFALERIAKKL
jgi:hypothetical protein